MPVTTARNSPEPTPDQRDPTTTRARLVTSPIWLCIYHYSMFERQLLSSTLKYSWTQREPSISPDSTLAICTSYCLPRQYSPYFRSTSLTTNLMPIWKDAPDHGPKYALHKNPLNRSLICSPNRVIAAIWWSHPNFFSWETWTLAILTGTIGKHSSLSIQNGGVYISIGFIFNLF